MEQSFNDCLYNLGSTVTLASSTALSNVSSFSSPCAGLPMPRGRAAQLGSHQEPPLLLLLPESLLVALPPSPKQGWEHASLNLSSHHASYQSSLCCDLQNILCLQNSSVSSQPSECLAVSQRYLRTKPLPTVIVPVPSHREGRQKDHLASDHGSAGDQGHAAAADLDTPLLNQDIWVFATPARELAATLRVTVAALVDFAAPDNN